ncbi:MAG TPA: ATP-dependent helicase [Solirubrobacteraceae bacterium]|jgi:DNA helicase-2/ATP-dependent DNA helicase PcrA|nr:ATP-dependent helicase [Solirubrobacteraceae bacterium]
MLTWGRAVDQEALASEGYEVVRFSALRREIDAAVHRAAGLRQSLANPAQPWLSRVARAAGLAVVGVRLRDLDDLRALHGYVLEPALRSGTRVAIESEQRLTRLDPADFVDPEFEFPYTLERALHAATRLYRGPATTGGEQPVPPAALMLDAEQRQAVEAADGIVQVIAPAGSGKTAVLIERVRELLRRGVPAEQILCTTFNRDARVELRQRLLGAGLPVDARTFHSIGWWLMRDEGLARRGGPRELSFNQWRRLCTLVLREEGTWIDPGDARAAIGAIKLGLMATPREFRAAADSQRDGPALARIYELYELHLDEQGVHDFDDLVLVAVRALREDAELRRRWQSRFRHVLVDEYQDIEPAQELLVRILAAPEDGFYCVGDEDQTLYGWRRASVRRIVDLDLAYPGLARVSLAHNYRCPPDVVEASRRLVEHNRVRFPKAIQADPSRAPGEQPALTLREHEDQLRGADEIAAALAGRTRKEIVVLARTTNLLRTVALACAAVGVRISAPEPVFEPHGARGALEAYLRLCAAPRRAEANDVALVCRRPSRGLPYGSEERVASGLHAGLSFSESLAGVAADARQRFRLDDAGRILDALAAITDAPRFVAYLRGPGGLDEYYTDYERTFGETEKIELEVLEQAAREAAGRTVLEYADLFQARRDALRAVRDDAHGIELTTIHRAKGREWPEVHVFGCEENQLPHRRALEVSKEEREAGEGIEAERRLAYVAFTRAVQTLVVHTTEQAASRFLSEAGLQPTRPFDAPDTARRADAPDTARRITAHAPPRIPKRVGRGPVAGVLEDAHRVGLAYALRTAPRRSVALEAAAAALEHGLIGRQTASERMTVAELLAAIEALSASERAYALDIASLRQRVDDPVARLGSGRKRLARALRRVSSASAGSETKQG